MFSGWMFAKLRAAERALEDGRIDEAYLAATQPDVCAHRRAQLLLDQLARPLLARARLHAEAGRYREAVEDLDRLEAVGRGCSEGKELRNHAMRMIKDRRARAAEGNEAYAKAVENVRAGRLDSGRAAVERIPDSVRREKLRDELDARVQRSDELLQQAESALARGDVLAACRTWEQGCRRHGCSRGSDELAARLVPELRKILDQHFEKGRLEQFSAALRGTELLRKNDPALDAYARIGTLCDEAARRLEASDPGDLRETLLRLQAAHPGAGWLKDALKSVAVMIDTRESLLASPLGLLSPACEKPGGNIIRARRELSETIPQSAGVNADERAVPLGRGRLLMLIDGTGSGLLVMRDVVRVGRAGGGLDIDLPIPADIQSHHADLIRDGEDFFLAAYGPATVNGRPVQRVLLRDNDRVVLGSSARFVFRKPSSKSESALLKLSDRCRAPLDVSHVVLFRDTCLIGPQASSHVRTREGKERLVLFDRAGFLYARLMNADGSPGGVQPVELDRTQDFGELRVTFRRYSEPGAGGVS